MAVLQTLKINICAMKGDRKQILEELQRTGAVQVEAEGDEDAVFFRMDTGEERNIFLRRGRDAENALNVLETYAPEKKGLLSSLNGREILSRERYEAQVAARKEVLEAAERILALQKKIGDARAQVIRAENTLESLEPWMNLDVPLDYRGTKSAAALIGTLPGHLAAEQIPEMIVSVHPELSAYEVEILGADKDQTCIFAVCGKEEADSFEDALRVNGFVRPTMTSSLTPAEYAKELQAKKAEAEKTEEATIEELKGFAGWRDKLRFAADYYSMRAEKYQVLGELLQSEHVFFLNGFVPAFRAEKLKKKLEQEYTCQVEIAEVPEDEEAPVLLKNNSFAEPTEGVVEAFGLPGKGEIDPTGIMAFFYYFLFGLMLSDAGYGIVMVIACAWAVKKFPNMEAGLQKMLRMFFFCGISTTFWGVMFGGYFGDVVTVVASTFFHKNVTVPAVWFAPLDEPIRLLMFSFLFGIIHLFVGLGVKGYMLLRDKAYFDFFAQVLCWYALLFGLILLLLPSEMFSSMAGTDLFASLIPGWVGVLAKWMAIVSAVCIVLFSEMGTKNIAARIALGAYDLYGVSSWLSDVLSYSRLLALGLATGVIGSVINTMGSMVGSGVVGFILFWIIFLVGHTLNIAINLLGAYVHTNRLQFVEFFGKFYEGGGRPFRSFSAAQNKYFKFREEE